MKNHNELAEINAKCDLIIELLDKLVSDPDFVINALRAIAARQNLESKKNGPTLKLVCCNGGK
nr:MAG TPA: hypothetical protein [Siphoviridae sp. ctYIp7]